MKKTTILSPTQQKLMELLVGGKATKQAAGILKMEENTAKTHLRRAKLKLGARTSYQAIAMFAVQKVKEQI